MTSTAALTWRLHQVRYSAALEVIRTRRLPVLRQTGTGPWDTIGGYRRLSVTGSPAPFDCYNGMGLLSQGDSSSFRRLRDVFVYKDTCFYVEDTRSPLDNGELQFWDIFATSDIFASSDTLASSDNTLATSGAWFIRVAVDIPRRQIHVLRRYEHHLPSSYRLPHDAWEDVLCMALHLIAGVPGAYLTRRRIVQDTRAFRIHPDPVDPVKVAEGPAFLQWLQERITAAAMTA